MAQNNSNRVDNYTIELSTADFFEPAKEKKLTELIFMSDHNTLTLTRVCPLSSII